MFKKRREERAVAKAQEAEARALAEWETQNELLADRVNVALNVVGDPSESAGMMMKKGEAPFLIMESVNLIEPRRGKGHYQGGSQGVSFRIAKGVSYRVGATKGTYVAGPEELTAIDNGGRAVITNQRLVFTGPKQTREWAFAKLVGVDAPFSDVTILNVTNRQKASGVQHGTNSAEVFRFRLEVALAHFSDTIDDLRQRTRDELAAHEATRPVVALPSVDQ